ncbi:MAG TPA: 4'-phosphopantetheinyl transferase superfamily protein [Polyangia bacterium]|jgi:holo-[acyl-carrier protein] synthase|nr:4'-phosphopantetheinyl transferase superfamily protein [Polyangia bacterium]
MTSASGGAPGIIVGVDLVQVSQVAMSLDSLGEAYMRRICTPDEIAYCNANPMMAPARFAARFAAKEATLKVLRLDDQGLDLRAIEVKQMPGGWTDLLLHGRAKQLADEAGWSSWSVSLSHEGDYATAVVAVLLDKKANG